MVVDTIPNSYPINSSYYWRPEFFTMNFFFDISPSSLNLFSFMLGMTFAAFLNWYKRVAFRFIIAYFAGLAFFFGAIKPTLQEPVPQQKSILQPGPDYSPPLPMPTPRGYK